MKINRSVYIAICAILVIFIWFFLNAGQMAEKDTAAPRSEIKDEVIAVITENRTAIDHQIIFQLYGRTEANREMSVKAETAGLIVSTPIKEGQRVNRGAVICRQDVDARQALLDQARAGLKTRELEYKAALALVEKGYQSATQAATALAALDGARASVKQAEIELDNVIMRAPFSGIFEQQIAEVGDYLGPGQPCGLLVELNPLIVYSELTESQIKQIKTGQSATIELATGESLTGKIRFIEARSDPATRTFRAEIAVPNADFKLKAGVTATVRFAAGSTKAHHIPSQILGLDDNGQLGVRYLDNSDRVHFTQVTTIDEDAKGIWVTGLPENVRIIVKGQEYVAAGNVVKAVQAGSQ